MLWFERGCETEGFANDLGLVLGITNGSNRAKANETFKAISSLGLSSTPGFYVHSGVVPDDWTYLWSARFATNDELANTDRGKVTELLRERWEKFLGNELKKIRSVVSKLKF